MEEIKSSEGEGLQMNFRKFLEGPDWEAFDPEQRENVKKMFSCSDCGTDISEKFGNGEYGYMLRDDLWKSLGDIPLNQAGKKMLCINCLEKRLGRKVTSSDFSKIMSPQVMARVTD